MALKRNLASIPPSHDQPLDADSVVQELKKAGVRVPKNFKEALKAAHHSHRQSEFSMHPAYVSGVLKACRYWKPHISLEDWDSLVMQELLSMASIHTSIINLGYLRKQNISLTERLSDDRAQTCVKNDGTVKVDYF